MELPGNSITNYIFPNNYEIWWSILIVIYPYITGLIAGAFIVSTLSHLFRIKEFDRIANFSLVTAFCFGCFAGVPLLFHLGQPQRALEIFITPHWTSPMSIFGYVYFTYMILLAVEIWLIYRPFFIRRANETEGSGLVGYVWYAMTLGVTTYHPDSLRADKKISAILTGLGIPWAFALHGYVGFIFGSVKAIAMWGTPLQPVVFILSAIVSGMAMLLLMYTFIAWRTKMPFEYPMIRKFMLILWGVFLIDISLEILELAFHKYELDRQWENLEPLMYGPLFETFIVGQFLILSLIPLLVLGYISLFHPKDKMTLFLANLACLMIVLQVLLMRYNVVIGGQLISKSERGFVEFHWDFFSREGVFMAAAIFIAPFVLYYVISRVIPIFDSPAYEPEDDEATEPHTPAP